MTTVFIVLEEDHLTIRFLSIRDPETGVLPHSTPHEVRQGQAFAGVSYEELRRLGNGEHDLDI